MDKKLEEINKAFKAVYSTENGKLVLDVIMKACLVDTPSASPDDKPAKAFYNAGKQEIGFWIKRKTQQ